MNKGKLTFFCGKMGAGKSTLANEAALDKNTVLFSEDEWLASIYSNKITNLKDYIKYSNQLKPQIKKTVQAILLTGTDVVMDFPANTVAQREWFRGVFSEVQAPHELLYIELSDEDCLKQIKQRREQQPERAATDTKEMFDAVTKFFVEPQSEEELNTTLIKNISLAVKGL